MTDYSYSLRAAALAPSRQRATAAPPRRAVPPPQAKARDNLLELGKVPQATATSHSGPGARPTVETWLTLPQINYLIITTR